MNIRKIFWTKNLYISKYCIITWCPGSPGLGITSWWESPTKWFNITIYFILIHITFSNIDAT